MPKNWTADIFSFAFQSDEIADSIRSFAQLEGRKPLLAIIDIGERRTYAVQDDEINKETIVDLIGKFKNCALDFVQLNDWSRLMLEEFPWFLLCRPSFVMHLLVLW